jgi:hypothetical protein
VQRIFSNRGVGKNIFIFMKKTYCYWTISWGDYDYIAQTMINSARNVGVNEDFYAFTEKPIKNCINFRLNQDIQLDDLQFFKFEYLKKEIKKLNYDYFIFIDADHFFVRKPDINPLDIIKDSPWHSFLESPINSNKTKRSDWWGVPNQVMTAFMKKNGVQSTEIRNSNGGFWICQKEFIEQASHLAYEFHNKLKRYNIVVPEEVSIAYLSHLMSPKIEDRYLEYYTNYWASDWTENFKDILPENRSWEYVSYMTMEPINVNPAIVHAMRSKKALIQESKGAMNSDSPFESINPDPSFGCTF